MISKCRLCGSSGLRPRMRDGKDRDLRYESPEGRRYDVVAMRHVLEHLPDPILAMQEIGAQLEDRGLALLEFPNTGSFSYKLKRILKNRVLKNARYSAEWRPGHVNEYCRKSFEYLLDRTGFELVVWRTYSTKPVANAFYRWVPIASKVRVLVRKLLVADTRREVA